MPTFQFTGKVVPIAPHHDIGPLLPFEWENIDTGERERYEVSFIGADVVVLVTINTLLDEQKISAYRNTAMEVARTALNIVCFATGMGLVLYLDRYLSPEGNEELCVPGDPRLQSLLSVTSFNILVMSQMLAADPQLSRPLGDLITAITWPYAAPINCARAIEGIRKHNNPSEGKNDRAASWGLLQEALNISRGYREYVIEISLNPRHGDSSFIHSDVQEDVIVRAWTIMDRYFQYLGHGKKPLAELGFPLL